MAVDKPRTVKNGKGDKRRPAAEWIKEEDFDRLWERIRWAKKGSDGTKKT